MPLFAELPLFAFAAILAFVAVTPVLVVVVSLVMPYHYPLQLYHHVLRDKQTIIVALDPVLTDLT